MAEVNTASYKPNLKYTTEALNRGNTGAIKKGEDRGFRKFLQLHYWCRSHSVIVRVRVVLKRTAAVGFVVNNNNSSFQNYS